jgi:hypothetical protein
LSSILKITLPCKLLQTQDKIVWLGVRDDFRNWLLAAASGLGRELRAESDSESYRGAGGAPDFNWRWYSA